MIFKVVLIFAVLNLTSGQIVGKCGEAASKKFGADAGRPMTIQKGKMDFPSDLKSSELYCSQSRVAVTAMRNFSRSCLTDLPKQANSLIAYGMNKAIKKTCKTEAERKKLGQNLGCFNKVKDQMSAEFNLLQENYQRSIFLTDNKKKIPSACCNFFGTMKKVLEIGATQCSKDQVNYLKFFLESFSNDVLELLCAGITLESDKCKTLVIPPKNVTSSLVKNDSFMPALLVLLDGLSS